MGMLCIVDEVLMCKKQSCYECWIECDMYCVGDVVVCLGDCSGHMGKDIDGLVLVMWLSAWVTVVDIWVRILMD